MSRDWFRKEVWRKSDEDEFFKRLKRANKQNNAQYLRIQALYLYETKKKKLVKKSIELLCLALNQYGDNREELCSIYTQLAQSYEYLGNDAKVIEYYRKSIRQQEIFPHIKNDAVFLYGAFVAMRKMTDLNTEVIDLLEKYMDKDLKLVYPYQLYVYFAVFALISSNGGNNQEAVTYAKLALEQANRTEPVYSRHKKLGLVTDKKTELYKRLKRIAKQRVWFLLM